MVNAPAQLATATGLGVQAAASTGTGVNAQLATAMGAALIPASNITSLAFPSKRLGVRVDLLLGGVWTDITQYVYQRNSISITNVGRTDWTSTLQPAQLTLTVNNRDGRFTPKLSSGAYFPNITRNTQIRIFLSVTSTTNVSYAGFRFYGEVAEWPVHWDASQRDVAVNIVASGIWRRLSQLQTPLGSAYRRFKVNTAAAIGLRSYWPIEDGSGSKVFVPFGSVASTQNATMAYVAGQAGISLASAAAFPGSDDIATLNAASITAIVPSGGTWSFTANGSPLDGTYFIASTAQAASLTVGDAFTDTNNPGVKFRITSIGAPFAGFSNVSITPTAASIMSSPDTVSAITGSNVTRFLLSVPSAGDSASGSTNWNLIEIDSTGTVAKFEVYLNATGTLLMQLRNSGGAVIASGTTTTNVKGTPYLVSCELTSGVNFALRIIKAGASGITESITGSLGSGSVGQLTKVIFSRALALVDTSVGHLSCSHGAPTSMVQEAYALNGYQGEFAADRFVRLCGELGITSSTIGAPSSSAPMGPQVDDTLQNVFQSIEDTDCGLLYELRDQFGMGYRTNASMANQQVQFTLNYSAATVDQDFSPAYDDQLTRNNITVSNWTGYTQQAVLTAGPMSVLNPPNGIGNGYNYSRSVNAANDNQCPGIANFLLNLGAVDEIRFPVVTVKMIRASSANLFSAIATADIGDYFQITNPPSFLTTTTIRQLVWGYSETLNAREWTFSFNTVPESPWETGFSPGTIQTAQIPGGSPVSSQAQGSLGLASLIANGSITPGMLSSGITFHTLGGNAVTISVSAPSNPNTGDIWIASATGLISQWNGSSWVPFKFDGSATIQAATITAAQIAAATIVASNIAAGTITAALLAAGIVVAGIVDATTITGALVQTASTVPAVQMDGSRDAIFGYDGSSNLLFSLAGASGTDFFGHSYPQGLFAQQITLNNQSSVPSAITGASIFYSSIANRPKFINAQGTDTVLERSTVNVAQFTVGNTTTPGQISATMSIPANEGDQSSEWEVEISGSAAFGTAANHNLDWRLFKDGSAYGTAGTQLNPMTLANSIVGTGISISYTVTWRVQYIGSNQANMDATGIWRDQNATTLTATNSGTMGGNAQALSWDPTISHTLEIRASWGATQTGQTLTTYRTKLTRRM